MSFLKVSCSRLRLVNAVLAATLNQAMCPFELKLAYAPMGIDCALLSYDTDMQTLPPCFRQSFRANADYSLTG